jgi:hypothetical protein
MGKEIRYKDNKIWAEYYYDNKNRYHRENNEPAFSPLPRRNPDKESLVIAYIPMEKDINKVIEAAKSCPILSNSTGRNLSLKQYKIGKKGSA